MNKIKEQMNEFAKKYMPLMRGIIANMRLVLLIVFSLMAGYLVYRVDSLVNQEVEPAVSDTPSAISKRPDSDVISIFNELNEQSVTLESNFENNRDNPF